MDLSPIFAHGVELELRLPLPAGPFVVVQLGTAGIWWWQYLVPESYAFRDGVVEREVAGGPALLRLPVRIMPAGVYQVRVVTPAGLSDTIEVRHY